MTRKLVVFFVLAGLISATCAAIALFRALNRADAVTEYAGSPAIGGGFDLLSDTGRRVTDADIRNKPTVMYFGYTYCPEVCPTTLSDLSHWISMLGPDADKLNYVFVTIDPQRDTQQVMHRYVSSFDKRIRGFTGTPGQIARIAREYRVYYRRIPSPDGSYSMDHSSIVYLMSRDGNFVGTIGYQEDSRLAVDKLRNLVRAD